MGECEVSGYLASVGDVPEASVRDLEKRKGQGVPGRGGWWEAVMGWVRRVAG